MGANPSAARTSLPLPPRSALNLFRHAPFPAAMETAVNRRRTAGSFP